MEGMLSCWRTIVAMQAAAMMRQREMYGMRLKERRHNFERVGRHKSGQCGQWTFLLRHLRLLYFFGRPAERDRFNNGVGHINTEHNKQRRLMQMRAVHQRIG